MPFLPLMPDACRVYTETFRSALMKFVKHLTAVNNEDVDWLQCPWPAVSKIIETVIDFIKQKKNQTKYLRPFCIRMFLKVSCQSETPRNNKKN